MQQLNSKSTIDFKAKFEHASRAMKGELTKEEIDQMEHDERIT